MLLGLGSPLIFLLIAPDSQQAQTASDRRFGSRSLSNVLSGAHIGVCWSNENHKHCRIGSAAAEPPGNSRGGAFEWRLEYWTPWF